MIRSAEEFLADEDAKALYRQSEPDGHTSDKEPAEPSTRRFQLTRFADIRPDGRRRYIVKNLLPRGGLIVVWGPPKCGKSFWVSDLALHVALGWTYRDRRVEVGVVVYVTCEGQSGFPARIEAFRRYRMADNDPDPAFYLLPTRLDLVGDVTTLIADIAAQLSEDGPALIVIDTLNRSLVGSESKDEDMSAYVQACDRIRLTFNCAVLVVHHCGIDEKRPRGHTSLTGAVDAQIAVGRDKAGNIVATVEYMKDGPEGDRLVNRLLPVDDIGTDEDGEVITSCVVEPIIAVPKDAKPTSQLPAAQRRALGLLSDAITRIGTIPEANDHIPASTPCVTEATWRQYCDDGMISESDKPDSKRKAFKRVSEGLLAGSRVGKWGGGYG